ncbi:MAG: rhomboid family intramembrane serine protease [Myxococcaceae bacterium]|nr:rhomboid family intramembrane serine protease [Myxococcaceae bacterium]
MRPIRSGDLFGRGGYLNVRSAAAKLALGMVAVTVVTTVLGIGLYVALSPALVFRSLALWQPLTYGFLETSPLGLIFGALIVWSMGSALEATWGSRRFLAFTLVSTVLAGVVTVLLGLVFGSVYAGVFAGGTVMATIVWVAYGWSFGQAMTNFWGLPVTGNVLALIGVGFVLLNAAFARSIVPVIPDLLGILAAYAYIHYGSPRTLLLKFKHWRYRRELKSRARHLNVVSGERGSRGSDRYLQ